MKSKRKGWIFLSASYLFLSYWWKAGENVGFFSVHLIHTYSINLSFQYFLRLIMLCIGIGLMDVCRRMGICVVFIWCSLKWCAFLSLFIYFFEDQHGVFWASWGWGANNHSLFKGSLLWRSFGDLWWIFHYILQGLIAFFCLVSVTLLKLFLVWVMYV